MPSGTAVSASAALWIVSPSSATDPDSATTTSWITLVRPRMPSESHRVRRPSREVSIAASTLSMAAWLCGVTRWASRCRIRDQRPEGWERCAWWWPWWAVPAWS